MTKSASFASSRRASAHSGAVAFCGVEARAQNSSLMAGQQRAPLTLSEVSWTYQKPEEPRKWNIHDLVTVMVNEKSVMTSDSELDRAEEGLRRPDPAGLDPAEGLAEGGARPAVGRPAAHPR